jgi:hypothetical protein
LTTGQADILIYNKMQKVVESPAMTENLQNEGNYIPDEFVQFIKQLAYMHDWVEKYTKEHDYLDVHLFPEFEIQMSDAVSSLSCYVSHLVANKFYFKRGD